MTPPTIPYPRAIAGFCDLISYLTNLKPEKRKRRQEEYGSLEENRDFLHQISPINQTERIDSPLLIVHGEMDSQVPIEQARKIASKLEDQGTEVRRLFFAEEGHNITRESNQKKLIEKIQHFLTDHN